MSRDAVDPFARRRPLGRRAAAARQIVEVRTDRTADAALHARNRDAAHEAVRRSLRG